MYYIVLIISILVVCSYICNVIYNYILLNIKTLQKRIYKSLRKGNMKHKDSKYEFISFLKKSGFFLSLLLLVSACQVEDFDLSGIVGSKAPDFTLSTTVGDQVHLFDYKDKVIVLYFFGNNCPHCIAEGPAIESELINPYVNRNDIIVLGLDYWNGDPDLVRKFRQITGLTIPLLLDAGNVATNYKTTYNRIVIIDKSLNIVFSGTQSAVNDLPAVKEKLDMLLAN